MKRVLISMGLLLTVATLRAHDPLEITATAFLFEDRLEIKMELEWATARLLTGAERMAVRESDVNAAFSAAQPALKLAAGGFLRVHANGELLPVVRTEATLANEDHVHFQVIYPPVAGRNLRIDAPGLARLPSVERYGVSLTVLDMVNKRVLGQSVLYADATEVEFAMTVDVPVPTKDGGTAKDSISPAVVVEQDAQSATRESAPSSAKSWLWPAIVAGLFVAGFVWQRARKS